MENLNVRIEKDPEGGWLAVLPPHPDMPDEEFGLPAETKEEAEAEARAYRAIEQSSLYKFDFDEDEGNYVVKLGQEEYRAPLLADAYGQAQAAYAERFKEEPPKAAEPAPAPAPKRTRARPGNNKPGNGETPKPEPKPEPPPKVTAPAPKPEPAPVASKPDAEQKARLDRIEIIETILVVMARTILKEIKGE